MNVTCINSRRYLLTKDREYFIINHSFGNRILIKNDQGKIKNYPMILFKSTTVETLNESEFTCAITKNNISNYTVKIYRNLVLIKNTNVSCTITGSSISCGANQLQGINSLAHSINKEGIPENKKVEFFKILLNCIFIDNKASFTTFSTNINNERYSFQKKVFAEIFGNFITSSDTKNRSSGNNITFWVLRTRDYKDSKK